MKGPVGCHVTQRESVGRDPIWWTLIEGRSVTMAVDDLPLAILATVDMCDADSHRSERTPSNGRVQAFIADGVGEIAGDLGS
jgi:hypothetical protein